MRIALLRVGIDRGCGGTLGPLFPDGSFEFLPIPERHPTSRPVTYGALLDSKGNSLSSYFPGKRADRMKSVPAHLDPDFAGLTYGDATSVKSSLATLEPGDLLVFYAGLAGWNWDCPPALYLIGYFVVARAARFTEYAPESRARLLASSPHYYHPSELRDRTLFVCGTPDSRRFARAALLSANGRDSLGRPLFVLSPEMREVFGDFGGAGSIQRCPPRWVAPDRVARAKRFIFTL